MTKPDFMTKMLNDALAMVPDENELAEGYFDYQARIAFRDLVRLHGFNEARRLMFQIINSECERKRQ